MQIIVITHLQLWAEILAQSIVKVLPDAKIEIVASKAQLEDFKDLSKLDLAIVDLSIPDKEGLDITRYILNLEKGPEVFISAQLSEVDLLKESLKYRVHSYITEEHNFDLFETTLSAFADNDKSVGRRTRKEIKQWVEKNESFITQVKLSKREREILRMICTEQTSTEIAKDLFISEHTVLTHRKNLLKKVGCKNTVGLVHYAYQNELI